MGGMKWWGWGDEGVSFTHQDKPALGPFLERHLAVDPAGATVSARQLPAAGRLRAVAAARSARRPERAVGEERVSTDALDRLVHARGKSLRDLVRIRRGDLGRLPDVLRPPRERGGGRRPF